MPSITRPKRLTLASTALAAVLLMAADRPGVDLAGVDRSVKPGDDFFAYANGTWVKTTEIPADRASWGTGGELAELTDKRVADLIKSAGSAKSPEAKQIAAYYTAYMDEHGIEAKGSAPLKPLLDRIAAIHDRASLSSYLGSTIRADVDALNNTNFKTDNIFGLWIAADLDDPTHYSPFLLQGGLSLPDRAYYVTDNARMAGLRTALKAHVAKVLGLIGERDVDAKADRIVALETAIAKAHWTRADSEEVEKTDTHWTRAELEAKAPGIDWPAFLGAAGLSDQKRFVAWQASAISGEAALVASQPIEVWKDYLAYHAADRYSGLLPKAFVDERFAFYGKTLSGTPALSERWKRGVGATNGALGMAVGKLYVAKYFPPADKAAVQSMVKDLLVAFRHRIEALDWMSPATKTKAIAKLKALKVGVGYPDHWPSYTGLEVRADDAFGNAYRAGLYDYRRKLKWLNGPVDRGEWVMNPQLVNAVNLPVLNALNFPAAELQPPHFDPKAPAAVNYASVGAIIGHEISHSFDDEGAKFDAMGRLRDWWTPADLKHFQAAGAALAKQFDGYCPFTDLCVNGKQTLSENIADVAGLAAAYDGWKLSLHGRPAPEADGLSGDQQFFLSFAQTWRNKTREAALRQQLLTDGHAPAQYRALTVRNLDAWYPAFTVKPGDKLYLAPDQRVKVW